MLLLSLFPHYSNDLTDAIKFSDVTCPQKSKEKGVDPECTLGFKIPNHMPNSKTWGKGEGRAT